MVQFVKDEYTRIKNLHRPRPEPEFIFSIYSFLSMLTLLIPGIVLRVFLAPDIESGLLIRAVIATLSAALIYGMVPRWSALVAAFVTAQIFLFAGLGTSYEALAVFEWSPVTADLAVLAGVLAAVVFGPSIQVVYQWDKVVVLRLGRFKAVRNPGIFFLLPLLDRCAAFVDTRIRVTDFSAEKILTRDTVPVHVDALAFWMIWNPQKAILEVENYLEAVTLSAQTALRDSIGKYSLSTLLSERETLYQEIQSILDQKTNPWGISILSVEFTDIVLPPDLEDVMSRQAQAEREKQARIYIAQAEEEAASSFIAASRQYKDNPEALQLRAMTMVYDGIKTRGSLVLLPSAALDQMNIGGVAGLQKLARQNSPETGGEESGA